MTRILTSCALLIVAFAASGCGDAGPSGATASPLALFQKPEPKIPAGTDLYVRLGTTVSSETSRPGDRWEGTTTANVLVDGKVAVPEGSPVRGQVKNSVEAQKGNRALLELEVTAIEANGETISIEAGAEPVIAGSPRARNLGAIAGGAAAGALIGKAVGGDGKDAAAGALIGGAAATAGVAASKGYQVALKTGTVMSFTVQ